MLQNYQEKYKYNKQKFTKEMPNIKDTKHLFNSMNKVYEDMKDHHNLNKYLYLPDKNMESDNAFKTLRPNCPFTLTELLDESKDKFLYYKYIKPEINEFKTVNILEGNEENSYESSKEGSKDNSEYNRSKNVSSRNY